MPRTGRRPGPSTTRAAILEVARAQFAHAGYDGTSLRAIAAEAGVDTGVVQHFFGSKDELFRAVVGWPFDPGHLEAELSGRSARGLGRRLARAFFSYWEDPTTGTALVAVLRSATTHAESAAFLREFVTQRLFARIAARIDARETDPRVESVALNKDSGGQLGAPDTDSGGELGAPETDPRVELASPYADRGVELWAADAGRGVEPAELDPELRVEPVALHAVRGVELGAPDADRAVEPGVTDAQLRVELAAGQLIGVAMLRYILKVEPVASASIDELIARLAPGLNRQLRAPAKRVQAMTARGRTVVTTTGETVVTNADELHW